MKHLIQTAVLIGSLGNGLVLGTELDRTDSVYRTEGVNVLFSSSYADLESQPTPVPFREPIGIIAQRITSNPLVALGTFQATSSALAEAKPAGRFPPFRSDQEVEEFLRTAEIVSQEHVGDGINNPLKMLLAKDGIQMYALFRDVHVEKPSIELGGKTKRFFRDEASFECAAYELSKMLGLDNVPPTVERNIGGKKGTLQAWVEGTRTRKEDRKNNVQPPSGGMDRWRWMMNRQVMYLFDNLIYNEDRNTGNILIEPSWRMWMIDHTRSFRRWKELPQPEKVQYCERSVWDNLQTLDETEVRERLKGFLNPAELNGLVVRIGLLIEHIQGLIAERGERQVLFKWR